MRSPRTVATFTRRFEHGVESTAIHLQGVLLHHHRRWRARGGGDNTILRAWSSDQNASGMSTTPKVLGGGPLWGAHRAGRFSRYLARNAWNR